MPNMIVRANIQRIAANTTSASTALNSDILDMQGYEGVMFMSTFNATATDNTLRAQAGTASTALSDLAGTAVDVTETSVRLNVHKPLHRYVRARVVRATATTIGDIWAIQYGGSKLPESNTATGKSAFKLVISPATGTATAT